MLNKQATLLDKMSIPDPVFYGPIQFYNQQKKIEYTDCWEISVLRFMHLLFGREGSISFDKLTKFMDTNNDRCQQLIQYFRQNPTYQMKQAYYQSEEGLLIRSKWCQFLNKSGLLDLKLEQKYEVKATIPNILAFFKGFFPKLQANTIQIEQMTYKNIQSGELFQHYEDVLNQLYKQISIDYKLTIQLDPIYNIQYNYLSYSLIQKLSLNAKRCLDWEINQIYQVQDQEITTRYGGHSDYRYSSKYK